MRSSSSTTVTIGVAKEVNDETKEEEYSYDTKGNYIYTQTQTSADNKRHIVGKGYPMYGVKKNVPKNKSPKFSMTHLSAIIALEIVNNGAGGSIIVKDAQIEAPEEIVGDFTVNLLSATAPTFTKGSKVSKVARIKLDNAAPITYGNSATLYLAVKPFDASSKDLIISINGSTKTVKMPANTKFTAGTITRIRVPVESLTHTLASDAFSVESKSGRVTQGDSSHLVNCDGDNTSVHHKVITTSVSPKTVQINGHDVKAYILGNASNGTTGKITITGFLRDLIKAIPTSFYVSGYDGNPAVMRVENISVSIPYYDDNTSSETKTLTEESYILGKRKKTSKTETYQKIDYATLKKRAGLLGLGTSFDLDYDMISKLGDSAAEKITFSNIAQNGFWSNNNVVVLNEEFTHKSITPENIQGFLDSFYSTYAGLYKIAMATDEELESAMIYEKTSVITYEHKYTSSLDGGGWKEETSNETTSTNWPPQGKDVTELDPDIVNTISGMYRRLLSVEVAGYAVAGFLVPNEYALLHMLRDVKVSITLSTTSTGPCVVFWGLDVNDEALPSDDQQ